MTIRKVSDKVAVKSISNFLFKFDFREVIEKDELLPIIAEVYDPIYDRDFLSIVWADLENKVITRKMPPPSTNSEDVYLPYLVNIGSMRLISDFSGMTFSVFMDVINGWCGKYHDSWASRFEGNRKEVCLIVAENKNKFFVMTSSHHYCACHVISKIQQFIERGYTDEHLQNAFELYRINTINKQ